MTHEENVYPSGEDAAEDAVAAEDAGPAGDEGDEAPPPPPPDVPTVGDERIRSLDLLRGVAVLGILMVNVWTFALPWPAALNPRLTGFDGTADRLAYALVGLFFYNKMMPVFAMLFGAGIVLFTSRVEARRGRSGRRWFARQWWLWVIGLLHGYLLWGGDILLPYAVVGLILYRFRRLRPRTLVILAVLALAVPKAGMYGMGEFMGTVRRTAAEAQEMLDAGDEPTAQQERFREMWQENQAAWNPDPTKIAEIADVMRGGYGGIFRRNGAELLMSHLLLYPLIANWSIAGLMLLGMALFKSGVLQGERSDRFYLGLAAVGYGLGLPGTMLGMRLMDAHFADMIRTMQGGMLVMDTSGPLVALGHVALLVLAARRRLLPRLQARLGAVGRMAFTNYLAQTLLGVTVFYGYGFGMFARLGRAELLLFVAGVWLLELAWSPWWLSRFRFGPAEWLWRTLTYGRGQALRRPASGPAPVPEVQEG